MRPRWLLALPLIFAPSIARAQQCPPAVVRVDNDIAGSGYSEERAANWVSRPTGACSGTYRYLSRTEGDGSRRGKAIWTPRITVTGWYQVVTSFRATGSRTSNADYVMTDDLGGRTTRVIDQRTGTDCTRADLGTYFCRAGGACRLVLDGTDDSESDSADITTFTLVRCGEEMPMPMPGACGGIAATAGFEVCEQSATRCAGVFTNGAGCRAYCAAAGMVCTARFGGEPGCMKETGAIPCDADNGHGSDWCECEAPVEPPPMMPPEEPIPEEPPETVLRRDGSALLWCDRPVRLVGYGDYGMVAEASFDVNAFLDRVTRPYGVNLIRVWGQYQWVDGLMPFEGRRGDWDLTRANAAFYTRLREVALAARTRGVVVMVTLFDTVQLEGSATDGNRWINSPYRDANNRQAYLSRPEDFNAVPPDETPPVWREVNLPYMTRVVDTLCDLPNVIYEVMNEPDGSGGAAGLGTPAFLDHAIGELHTLLARPRCTGSRLIASNDVPLRTLPNPAVDVITMHVTPERAAMHGGHGKPVIVSNDGDISQVTSANGFGMLSAADRAARIGEYGTRVFGGAPAPGVLHLEVLDKDLYGPTWLTQDYDLDLARVSVPVLEVLSRLSPAALGACPAPPAPEDAGVVDASPSPDAGAVPDAGEAPDAAAVAEDASPGAPPDAGVAEELVTGKTTCGCSASAARGSSPLAAALGLALALLLRRTRRR